MPRPRGKPEPGLYRPGYNFYIAYNITARLRPYRTPLPAGLSPGNFLQPGSRRREPTCALAVAPRGSESTRPVKPREGSARSEYLTEPGTARSLLDETSGQDHDAPRAKRPGGRLAEEFGGSSTRSVWPALGRPAAARPAGQGPRVGSGLATTRSGQPVSRPLSRAQRAASRSSAAAITNACRNGSK